MPKKQTNSKKVTGKKTGSKNTVNTKRKTSRADTRKKASSRKNKKETVKKVTPITEDDLLYVQDWCPIEKIRYGMIKTKDGRYINILEIEPITFLLRTFDERAGIIAEFQSWLKIAPIRLQFMMTTTPVDSVALIDQINKETENETDPKVLARRDELIEHIRRLSLSEALSKRFFLIYQYEGNDDGKMSTDEDEIWKVMAGVRETAKAYFYRMGNSIISHENESTFVGDILYKLMNPKSSQFESLSDRIGRITSDTMLYEMSVNEKFNVEDIPDVNYICPRGIDFTHSNYVIMDGIYTTWLYVKSNGYSGIVYSGWFDRFTNFGKGVTVNFYAVKKNRYTAINRVGRTVRLKHVESREMAGGTDEQEGAMNAADNADFIRHAMRDYNEDLYDCITLITIQGETEKEMFERRNRIKKVLLSKDCFTDDCMFHTEAALKMSLPLLDINDNIMDKGRRNFLTSSLASTYMYTAYKILENDGIVLGINIDGDSLFVPNPFNSKKYSNANMIVLGTSGKGKTFFLMNLAYSIRISGKQVFVVLPEKGREWKRLTAAIGGTYIELAPGSKDCINIMAIRPARELDYSQLEDMDEEDDTTSLLVKKIHQIITFIQLNMNKDDMTDPEEAQISTVLTRLYNNFGITGDNDSIWADKDRNILKKMPVIEDFYDAAKEDDILKNRIAVILDSYVHGDGRSMNAQTNVDLNNKFVVISVSKAGKKKLAPFAFLAIDCCYDTIKADRSENCALIMDEVWKMMINKYASEYVMEIYKIIRGYGGSAVAATQELEDLNKSENGAGVINNAKLKFIFGMEKKQAENLKDILDITDDDIKSLTKQDRGQALFFANGDKVRISVKAPHEWMKYFTTDAKELRKQKMKAKGEDDV